jgi:hypothetical protein
MECNNFGLCETRVRAEDLGISLLNATGKGICKICHLDSMLNACARLSALDEVRRILKQIVQSGMHHSDVYIGRNLLNMHAECGSIEDAWSMF